MRKRLLGIILVLIVIFTTILAYNIYFNDSSEEKTTEYSGDVSSSVIMDEIDDTLLDEKDEVEIGEMI
ncbi:MAG: hypothetical protein KGY65_07730 [Candidatus Thermoplasmatota archaeon]|nr:hypothetical protein [Candidatus Thermoplasmatota archaeon]